MMLRRNSIDIPSINVNKNHANINKKNKERNVIYRILSWDTNDCMYDIIFACNRSTMIA